MPEIPFRGRLGSVGVLASAHFINDSYSYILQAILPSIIAAFGLTVGMGGGLVAIYQITASFVQPVLGHLADRSALRWPAWAGVAAAGIGIGLLGQAPNVAVLVGLLVLAGLGTAIFHPVSAAMVGTIAPPRSRGRWLGLYVTAGFFGTAAGPFVVGPLLERSGPSGTWPILLPAVAAGLVVALFAPARRAPSRAALPLRQIFATYGRVLAALITVCALRAWGFSALSTFIPLLGDARGLGPAENARVLTWFLLSGALGSLIGGLAGDRLGRDRVLVGWLILSVPFGLYLALVDDAGLGFALAAAGSGFFLMGSYTVLLARGQDSVPGSVGMINGIMLGLSVGLGGLAVAPLALLSESIGLPLATALAAVLGGVAAFSTRLLPRTGAS